MKLAVEPLSLAVVEIQRIETTGMQRRTEPWKLNLPFAKIAKYLAIGLEIPSAIVGGVVFGYLADQWLGTSPWLTVLCSVAGFVGAVFRLVKYLKHFSRDAH